MVYFYVYFNFWVLFTTLTETFPIDYGPWGERVTSLSKALFRRIFNLFLSPISTRWVFYVPLLMSYVLCFDRFFFILVNTWNVSFWWRNILRNLCNAIIGLPSYLVSCTVSKYKTYQKKNCHVIQEKVNSANFNSVFWLNRKIFDKLVLFKKK